MPVSLFMVPPTALNSLVLNRLAGQPCCVSWIRRSGYRWGKAVEGAPLLGLALPLSFLLPALPFLPHSASLHRTPNGVLELEPRSPDSKSHAPLASPTCARTGPSQFQMLQQVIFLSF